MTMNWLHPTQDGCIVVVKATPRANRSEIVGADSEWLRVRLKAPPVDGKANAELIAFFAKFFDVPKSAVELLTGDTSRLKRLRLHGVAAETAAARVSVV